MYQNTFSDDNIYIFYIVCCSFILSRFQVRKNFFDDLRSINHGLAC